MIGRSSPQTLFGTKPFRVKDKIQPRLVKTLFLLPQIILRETILYTETTKSSEPVPEFGKSTRGVKRLMSGVRVWLS